jgi:type I restriction enzyme S subunit
LGLKFSEICDYINDRVNVSDLTVDTYISTENMLPNKEGITRSAGLPTVFQTSAFNADDVLISNIRPYFRKIWFADRNGGCSNDVLVLRARENCVPNYLYYLLSSNDFFDYATATAKGTKMPRGDKTAIMNYEVSLPSIPEQKRIAAVLAALDEKIAVNNKINHNLEQTARAVFKSWFVDFEPWGGNQPNDWAIGKAEDFFGISIGKTPPRKEQQWFTNSPSDVVWVSISDMGSSGVFISDSSEYLTSEAVSKFNIKVIPKGTVILSFKLTVGRVAITNCEITTNEAIANFQRSDDLATEYLYCYLKNFDYQSLGNTSSIATAVNSKTIKNMSFVMPDIKTLNSFHDKTSVIFQQIRCNLEDSSKLVNMRDSLLPRLMSGELSVDG